MQIFLQNANSSIYWRNCGRKEKPFLVEKWKIQALKHYKDFDLLKCWKYHRPSIPFHSLWRYIGFSQRFHNNHYYCRHHHFYLHHHLHHRHHYRWFYIFTAMAQLQLHQSKICNHLLKFLSFFAPLFTSWYGGSFSHWRTKAIFLVSFFICCCCCFCWWNFNKLQFLEHPVSLLLVYVVLHIVYVFFICMCVR